MVDPTKFLSAAVFLLFIFHCDAIRHVAHLQLDRLRSSSWSDPNEGQIENLLGRISTRPREIYCTDSVYPNDIFCDVSNAIDPYHEVTSVSLEYANPSVRGGTCTMNFQLGRSPSPSKLEYTGGSCSGDRSVLPMTRVAYVTMVKVGSRNPSDSTRCKKNYTNSGKIGILRNLNSLDRYRSPMKFTYYEGHCSA